MHPQSTNSPHIPTTTLIGRFIGGALTGAGLLFIPYTLAEAELNAGNFALLAIVMIGCGLLAMKWGAEFIEAVLNALSASGY